MAKSPEKKPSGKNTEEEFSVYMGRKSFIFVSYSHADWETVNGILRILFREGFRVWYDEQADGIPAGNDWEKTINSRLKRSRFFLIFISPSAVERPEVIREFRMAAENGKKILPIFLERVPLNVFPEDLQDILGRTQYIGLWNYGGVTQAFAKRLLSSPLMSEGLLDMQWRREHNLPAWNPGKVDIRDIEDLSVEGSYIYENASPLRAEKTIRGEPYSFYMVNPGETDPEAVYPAAMDNQWCPAEFYGTEEFQQKGFTSEKLKDQKEKLQKTEIYRCLLHSLQVIVNRAYLRNSSIFLAWYQEDADQADREAFGRLLESGAVVAYLYQEDQPAEDQKFGTVDEMEWQKLCQDHAMYCLRMDWEDKETNKKETEVELNYAFHDYCVITAENSYRLESMMECFHVPEEREEAFRACWKKIQASALAFSQEHVGKGYTREMFYRDFLVKPGTEVVNCILRKDAEFAQGLKQGVDLCYNRNLARALGLKLQVPADMMNTAVSLQDDDALFGRREINVEELIYAAASFSSGFLPGQVSRAGHPDLTIAQVEGMRNLPGWRDYERAKAAGQRRASQWDIDFHDIAVIWQRYQEWMEEVQQSFPDLQWKEVPGAVSIIYRFGTQVITSVYRADKEQPLWHRNKTRAGVGKVRLMIDFVCGDVLSKSMDKEMDSCFLTEIRFFEGETHENGKTAANTFWDRVTKKGETDE